MREISLINPADQAAEKALSLIYECIEKRQSFLLEAGAGAGKTHSLVKALQYVIEKHGLKLIRRHQQIACITYTNVACEEIKARTDGHPVVLSSTIHGFCWSLIKSFQSCLREFVPQLPKWSERLAEAGGMGERMVEYDLGYPIVKEGVVSLHHDDVISLTIMLLEKPKFRRLLTARYPILFIDEYQDTNKKFVESLKSNFLENGNELLIGFFGDHWQKIYDGGGSIQHPNLKSINKGANFRSVRTIVDVLNHIRPELPQDVSDPQQEGFIAVYHTNDWVGARQSSSHWKDDLPGDVAHRYLELLKEHLITQGWDFSPEKSKILMLTHNVLANEQGYGNLAKVFQHNDAFAKKEDPHIAFFIDTLEPVLKAYKNKKYGEMFEALGGSTPSIKSHSDKVGWARDMDSLFHQCSTGTIGDVLDHLKITKRPRLPDNVEKKEKELEQWIKNPGDEEPKSITQFRDLRAVSYQEVAALDLFINEKTPFSTKHGVKGAQFENVLVIFGRGWNKYNFTQFLEWAGDTNSIPPDKYDAFERNRNLFYVVCSRPQKRLALLFTQKLSGPAITTLSRWFGEHNLHSMENI